MLGWGGLARGGHNSVIINVSSSFSMMSHLIHAAAWGSGASHGALGPRGDPGVYVERRTRVDVKCCKRNHRQDEPKSSGHMIMHTMSENDAHDDAHIELR